MVDTFSYSAISSFENCPLAYKFRYVEKRPEAFTTIETHMGRVVHEVLHWAYAEHERPDSVTQKALNDRFGELWGMANWSEIRIVRNRTRREDYFQMGQKMLFEYRDRVMTVDERINTHLEYSFTLELNADTGFHGVVDRIARYPDGMLQVIDYKTGRTGDPGETLQLPGYALFAFEAFPLDQRVQMCFEDLKTGRTRTAILERTAVPEVRNRLLRAMEPIRKAVDYPARPSGLCGWCGYAPQCPAAKVPDSGTSTSPGPSAGGEMDGACPLCGSPLAERSGKFGRFMGCTAFPECRYAVNLENGGSDPGLETPGKEICPECGGRLRERKGRFGNFIGCSRYPGCRYSRDSW